MVNLRAWAEEVLEEGNPEALFIDSADDAIVGTAQQFTNLPLVVYSYPLLVKSFMAQGMDEEEAVEWISFNVVGAWMGPNTPLIMNVPESE